jgi:GTPase SAR1 family protein
LREDQDIIQQLADRGQDVVSLDQAEKVRNKIKAVKYMECSAKNNEGVKNVFLEATKIALQHREDMLKKRKKTKSKCIIL